MTSLIASIFMYAGGPITGHGFALLLLAFGVVMLVGTSWEIIERWIKRARGRNWPTVPAVVDIVSVVFCDDDTLPYSANTYHPYYLATLSYSYRYPEQQMGDYSRRFGDKDEAQSWANSYKGEAVKVHVDPSDPTRSVLRTEDL